MVDLVIPEDFCHDQKPVGKTSHGNGKTFTGFGEKEIQKVQHSQMKM